MIGFSSLVILETGSFTIPMATILTVRATALTELRTHPGWLEKSSWIDKDV